MTVLESEIKNIIEEVICGKYIGRLKVVQEPMNNSTLWMLLLYINLESSPMIMAYEGTEKQFKDFITSELKSRKLENVHFWTAVQELPTEEDIEDDYE